MFLVLRRMKRYIVTNVYWSSCNVSVTWGGKFSKNTTINIWLNYGVFNNEKTTCFDLYRSSFLLNELYIYIYIYHHAV